jgi:D-amino-acid oxidase
MRERCEAFLPGLKNTELVEGYPFAQGLRPAREENVRVEREKRGGGRSRIVHNYGQGRSRWSLSFGCSADVLALVEDVLGGAKVKAML